MTQKERWSLWGQSLHRPEEKPIDITTSTDKARLERVAAERNSRSTYVHWFVAPPPKGMKK